MTGLAPGHWDAAMGVALGLARAASSMDDAVAHPPDVPVGAVVVGPDDAVTHLPDVPVGAVVVGPDDAVTHPPDVPVGAVVVGPDGTVIAGGTNAREAEADPTAHAEVVALRAAGRALGSWRLDGCTLVVSLEPCAMCAGALIAARVDRVVFGAWDPKAGACGSVFDLPRDRGALHHPEVIGGVMAQASASLLTEFFAARRPGSS